MLLTLLTTAPAAPLLLLLSPPPSPAASLRVLTTATTAPSPSPQPPAQRPTAASWLLRPPCGHPASPSALAEAQRPRAGRRALLFSCSCAWSHGSRRQLRVQGAHQGGMQCDGTFSGCRYLGVMSLHAEYGADALNMYRIRAKRARMEYEWNITHIPHQEDFPTVILWRPGVGASLCLQSSVVCSVSGIERSCLCRWCGQP